MLSVAISAQARRGFPLWRSLDMPPLDYKAEDLYARGRIVDSFCVTGLAVEVALQLSRSLPGGCSALRAKHMPDTVAVGIDGRGQRQVKLHDENKCLAVTVAKHIRVQLHKYDMEMVKAVVDVRDARGRKLGAHDLIAQVVSDEPDRPTGDLSAEVRLRRIRSDAGRRKVREEHRRECCDQCDWWQQELASSEVWAGRLIVLIEFGVGGSSFTSRADLRLRGEEFKGLWGWPGSVGALRVRLRSASSALAPGLPLSLPSARIAHGRVVPPPRSAAKRRAPWDLFKKKLAFRHVVRQRVASVASLYSLQGKTHKKLKARIDQGMAAHGWTSSSVFTTPRAGAKKGGAEEWVATEPVLQQMYEES